VDRLEGVRLESEATGRYVLKEAQMGFFRHFAEGLGHSDGVVGLAEAASSWGWEPVEGDPLDGLTDAVHGVARTLHGVPWRASIGAGSGSADLGRTIFHDAYRGTADGRRVTVANAWIAIEAVVAGGRHLEGNAIVAVELSTILPISVIEPRGRHQGLLGAEVPTGNPSFDAAYRVVGIGSLAAGLVTPEMQQRIAVRDNWAFIAQDTTCVAVCSEPFTTATEVTRTVSEVLGIVTAVPTNIAPAQIDRTVDDLLVRIARIDSVEDALAFLQQLSDTDRERLAASPTPLAKFADVRTPDEAIARLMSLPELERLQVLAMFDKASDT
jgi:hypothetical protein